MAASAPRLQLFGPVHLAILISVPLIGWCLGQWSKRSQPAALAIRYGLATFLAVNEVIWYVFRIRTEGFRFPNALPLNLCDVMLWVTVVAALTLKPVVFEAAYFAGIAGMTQALLTPDLWAPLASYPTIYFFLAHGMAVATILTLVWAGLASPRPGSWWKMLVLLNAYAAVIGIFDAVFKTDYMYLCQKPAGGSLLDFFGPWPYYLVPAELVAIAVFWLLSLPFRGKRRDIIDR